MTASRPIFVAGSARSGTTLLQSALGAHPRIAAPPELYFVARISSLADYYGDLRDDAALQRALRATVEVPLLASLALDVDALLDRAGRGPRTYGGLLDAVLGGIAESWGKPRWSDKTPWQAPSDAWALLPEAQVIHIVRDPRDVVASSQQAPWIDQTAAELARQWRRFNLTAVRDGGGAGPSRYLRIRYEDLVADPEAVLRLVCTFLGEDFDGRMLDPGARASSGTVVDAAAPWQDRVGQPIDDSRIGRHREALGRRDACLVAAAVHGDLAALGYHPPRWRAVFAGHVLRPTELPADLRRARRYLRLRRRLAPEQRHAEVAELVASSLAAAAGREDAA